MAAQIYLNVAVSGLLTGLVYGLMALGLSVIFGVVLINAIVGYIQEARAEKAISSLARMVRTQTTVRRGGRKQRVPSEELVPGDIVLLESGDKVPADLRLFLVRSLQVDESSLTGESVPVDKHADSLAPDTILAERRNLAFAGTLVTYGRAEGVVWATGDKTEMGRIAWLIPQTRDRGQRGVGGQPVPTPGHGMRGAERPGTAVPGLSGAAPDLPAYHIAVPDCRSRPGVPP